MSAAAQSLTMLVGEQLAAAKAFHEQCDQPHMPRDVGRAAWDAVTAIAETTLRQKPESAGDILLQLSTAAVWADSICDAIDEKSPTAFSMGRAISLTIEQAALWMNRGVRLEDGPVAELVRDNIEQLVVTGAELGERERALLGRRDTWADAVVCYEKAKVAADAARDTGQSDASNEAEVGALDHLINDIPAPDGMALAHKIVLAANLVRNSGEIMCDDHAEAIIADARRFAGDL